MHSHTSPAQTQNNLKVTYIHHSGFLVEASEAYYLFDYEKGTLPPMNTAKPILVFVSHGHSDHYNPEIFSFLASMGMKSITAVLSNDIHKKRFPSCLMPALLDNMESVRREGFIPVIKAYNSQTYALPFHTTLRTLLSTDKGVAFYLTCPEGAVYHGGDLNDWISEETPEQERRQMTGSYLASIAALKGKTIDVAFLPLDPWLGKYYAKGFVTFLQTALVKQAYPMHYWDQPEIIDRFLQEYPEYAEIIVKPEPSPRTWQAP